MAKAIAYFCNGIGNLVMMMPALEAMKILTGEKIDVVLAVNGKDYRVPVCSQILQAWTETVDQVFEWPRDNFHPPHYTHWFFSPHGSTSEIVIVFKEHSRGVPVARPEWRGSLIHEVDHYMAIAYAHGYVGPVPQVNFPLSEKKLIDETLPRPYIGLCNGAFTADYWDKKHWPHFVRLARVLKDWTKGTIVGVGLGTELDGVPVDLNFVEKLTILETARVISQLDLLVTTDTGNMHIANILNVPLIALFGSTLTSKNAPRATRSTSLIAGIDCAPCQDTTKFMRCSLNLCMSGITVGDVMSVVREKLKKEV